MYSLYIIVYTIETIGLMDVMDSDALESLKLYYISPAPSC